MKVNITNEVKDVSARSLILALQSFGSVESIKVLTPERRRDIVNTYLSDYEKYILSSDNNIFTTDKICEIEEEIEEKVKELYKRTREFEDEEEYESVIEECEKKIKELESIIDYEKMFCTSTYNLIDLLNIIDLYDEASDFIVLFSAKKSYKDNESAYFKLIHNKESLIWLELGIEDFFRRENAKRNVLSCDLYKSNIVSYLQEIERFQNIKNIASELEMNKDPWFMNNNKYSEGDSHFFDFFLLLYFYRIKQQCNLRKIYIALLFIMNSLEHSVVSQEYAYTLSKLIRDIAMFGMVHKIYLQYGIYDSHKDIADISSDSATTRISLLLSVRNEDIYILRIDLPHKGENVFHLNMEQMIEDKVVEAGYPISKEQLSDKCGELQDDIYDSLFFELGNMVWFKARFVHIIEHIDMNENTKENLKKLFREQSHLTIMSGNRMGNAEDSLLFSEELKEYLIRFNMNDSKLMVFGKEDIDYLHEVRKINGLFALEERVNKVFNDYIKNGGNPYEKIDAKDILKIFADYMRENIAEEEYKEVNTIFDVWKRVILS